MYSERKYQKLGMKEAMFRGTTTKVILLFLRKNNFKNSYIIFIFTVLL